MSLALKNSPWLADILFRIATKSVLLSRLAFLPPLICNILHRLSKTPAFRILYIVKRSSCHSDVARMDSKVCSYAL